MSMQFKLFCAHLLTICIEIVYFQKLYSTTNYCLVLFIYWVHIQGYPAYFIIMTCFTLFTSNTLYHNLMCQHFRIRQVCSSDYLYHQKKVLFYRNRNTRKVTLNYLHRHNCFCLFFLLSALFYTIYFVFFTWRLCAIQIITIDGCNKAKIDSKTLFLHSMLT